MDNKIYVGIDPGVKTGWAIYSSSRRKLIDVRTKSFLQVLVAANEIEVGVHEIIDEDDEVIFCIESPGLNKPTFPRNVNRRVIERISRNVGANCREAELLISCIGEYGFRVIKCRPKRNKLSRGKMKAKEFQRLTGYEGRTSQHGRDAALLVWGRS